MSLQRFSLSLSLSLSEAFGKRGFVLDEYSGASSIFSSDAFSFSLFLFCIIQKASSSVSSENSSASRSPQRNAAMMMRSTRCRSW